MTASTSEVPCGGDGDGLVLTPGSPLFREVEYIALHARIAVFCGIPGTGKSLMLGQLARLAHAAGRPVHLLQWDVARLAFETPAVLARFPEVDGVTHAVIRSAAGFWARRSVIDWIRRHIGDDCLLAVEAPLVGGRFAELTMSPPGRPKDDLSLPDIRFVLVVPSVKVRREIERARNRTSAAPAHERETADAAPQVVSGLWAEVMRAARELGFTPKSDSYDPRVYRRVYARALRLRNVDVMRLEEVLPTGGRSAHDIGFWAKQLQPGRQTAEELVRMVADLNGNPADLEKQMARWFLP